MGASVAFGLVQASNLGEDKVRLALTGSGTAASLYLDGQAVAALTPETAQGSDYERLVGGLQTLATTFGLSDLYVVRPVADAAGEWEFVFDTADGPFEGDQGPSGGFSPYESPPDELEQAWASTTPVVTAHPYTDEYGTFRSAFLTLRDAQGVARAVVGSDFNLFVDKLRVLVGDLRTDVAETSRIQLVLQRDSEESRETLARLARASKPSLLRRPSSRNPRKR